MDRQPENEVTRDSSQAPERGLFLRVLYRVYTNYLGVTPPTPEQERIAAAVLIGGVLLGLVAIILVVFLLWRSMAQLGAGQ